MPGVKSKSYTPLQKAEFAKKMAVARARKAEAALASKSTMQRGNGNYYQRTQRSKRLYGNGKYYFRDGYGKELGSQIAGPLGGLIGEGIQSFGRAIGFGDYKVEHNSLLDAGMWGNSPPVMANIPKNLTHIVRHREYICDIYTAANGAFNLQSFNINPGLASTFPWLSGIAQAFEQYKVLGMIWEFKSTSADALNSTNTALGTIAMATEYDSSRADFQNLQQMLNHEFATSQRQSASCFHAIECKKSLTPVSELWVRTGAVPTGDDERLYDFANFQIATTGNQSSSPVNIGQLWVTYEVQFFKPQLLAGLGLELLTDHYSTTASISTSHYFGLQSGIDPLPVSGSNLGTTLSGNSIVFPPTTSEGTFMVIYQVSGGASATVGIPTLSLTNCQTMMVWQADTGTQFSNTGTTSQILIHMYAIKITGQNAKISLSGGTLPGTPTSMDLWVNQFNGNISS